jgi:hypothetical protein
MDYYTEGFNGFLNGEQLRHVVERLGLNWLKPDKPECRTVWDGYRDAEKMDHETRPQAA